MIRVTYREEKSARWLELEIARDERRIEQRLFSYATDFSHQIEGVGGLAATYEFDNWEAALLAGATTAFTRLRIAPSRLQIANLRGRLTAEDLPALGHAAAAAVMALFGGSSSEPSLSGWSCEVRTDDRADAPHAAASAPPHLVSLRNSRPGNQFIPKLGRFSFKRADTPEEFEQVHRLNYRTFVKEIQQHADSGTGRLVDKFHEWNTYFLAILDDRVIGMLSVHDRAPFSVEARLPDAEAIRRPGMRPLEVRLLAIEHAERHGPVLVGLTYVMNYFARENGYTHYLISAVVEQIPLYKHLGFHELGPAKGKPGAMFAPMMATLEDVDDNMKRTMVLWEKRAAREAAAAAKNV